MLSEITRYFERCILLDDKVIWEYVQEEKKMKDKPEDQNEILVEKPEIEEQVAQKSQIS